MLEKPKLSDEKIAACLQAEYGLSNPQISFLPIGADRNTAVYRVTTLEGIAYFLKLRSGPFDESCVVLPKFFSDQGMRHIIAPLLSRSGQLWENLNPFKTILYPFVEGQNAYEIQLSDHHWIELGTALEGLHTTFVPEKITKDIRKETYSNQWREAVRSFLKRIETESYHDPIAIQLVEFLHENHLKIHELLSQTDRLAQILQDQSQDFIVCHSDLHAGNLLISGDGSLYIVDWDEPIMAPKERDLMYIGGGLLASGRTPEKEEELFYSAYGQAEIDPVAVAYYRYDRIVRDIAEYCEELLLTEGGGDDREQSLSYLKSNFLPGGPIEIADQFSSRWEI